MFSSGMSFVPLEHAVRDGRSDIAVVAREVGARAAQLGVPLHEVIDHVERAHVPNEPSIATIRATALAWVEEALRQRMEVSCEHPLTSLSTVPHLRSRLGDVYRGAERHDSRAADTHALVVVELPSSGPGNELEQSLRALDVAESMRTVFPGDETIAQVSPRRFAALASLEDADSVTISLLAMMLARALGDDLPVRMWVERLPASADGVAAMLAGLSA